MFFLALVSGLVMLAFAGDALVSGSTRIAQALKIPQLVIGLTIVAFGTSAPELMVSVEAALHGAPDLAVGNVIGSNITNSLLVIGVPALIAPFYSSQKGLKRNIGFMMISFILFYLLMRDGNIDRFDALILILGLVIFLVFSFVFARSEKYSIHLDLAEEAVQEQVPLWRSATLVIVGMIGLTVGGQLAVDGALGLAEFLHLKHSAVGLTIIAFGTSLPELAAGIAAARRHEHGIIMGNVVGSNIFNLLSIAGITAAIAPLTVAPQLIMQDAWIMIASGLVLGLLVLIRRPVNRWIGLVLTLAYLAYMIEVLTLRVAV